MSGAPTQELPAGGAQASGGRPASRGSTVRTAPVPRRPAVVGAVGMAASLLLAALGVLALFDGMAAAGWVRGSEPVLTPALTTGLELNPTLPVAVVAALVAGLGLLLVWTALRRGRRAGVRIAKTSGVWMRYGDLERLCAGTAERVDGVLEARAKASRTKVAVSVVTAAPEVAGAVQAAVQQRLSGLDSPPRVSVRTHPSASRGVR